VNKQPAHLPRVCRVLGHVEKVFPRS